jgi:hypothetical protein
MLGMLQGDLRIIDADWMVLAEWLFAGVQNMADCLPANLSSIFSETELNKVLYCIL